MAMQLPERKVGKGERRVLEALRDSYMATSSLFTIYELVKGHEDVAKSTARRLLKDFLDRDYVEVLIEYDGLKRQWYVLTEAGKQYIHARLERAELDDGAEVM